MILQLSASFNEPQPTAAFAKFPDFWLPHATFARVQKNYSPILDNRIKSQQDGA